MTRKVDPYSRLYWGLIDDPKFADIYADDRHFSLWCRLLIAADMSWPASAALPFGTKKASVTKLYAVRLIDLLPGDRYRIHGLDTERGKRQTKAEAAAGIRHAQEGAGEHPISSANEPSSSANGTDEQPPSSATGVPRRDETRRDETSTSSSTAKGRAGVVPIRDGLPNITDGVQTAGEAITHQGILSAGDKQLTELDRLCEVHGADKVIAAFGSVSNGKRKSWRQLVWDSVKVLEPFAVSPSKQDVAKVEDTAAEARRWDKAKRENAERVAQMTGEP